MPDLRTDYHIHSRLSLCADRSMTVKRIIREALRVCVEPIAITDHVDVVADRTRCLEVAEELRRLKPDIRVLVGCEVEATRTNVPVDAEFASRLDFVLVATTHPASLTAADLPEDTPQGLGEATVDALERAAALRWAHAVAHPLFFFQGKPGLGEALEMYGGRFRAAMEAAARNGVALELSPRALSSGPLDHVAAFYRMCVDCGAKISLGSDAHRPENIGSIHFLFSLLDRAGISEESILIV